MDRVWMLSQDPALHPRWDLRFSRIVPTASDQQGPVRFRYEFWLPLHTIRGSGTSLGHRYREDGQATSVLKFDTSDALSPIGAGSGFWRYIPTEAGVRFITGYNYRPGMGIVGKALDARLIRPALGWATAISFDRLRLWAESDLDPADSRNRWIIDAAARAGGVLSAGVLLGKALTGRNAGWAFLAGPVLLALCALPAHWTVPRAVRCRRQAPDPRSGRAPSALDELSSPSASNIAAQSGMKEE
jgi:hypothetical protein